MCGCRQRVIVYVCVGMHMCGCVCFVFLWELFYIQNAHILECVDYDHEMNYMLFSVCVFVFVGVFTCTCMHTSV